MYVPKSSLPNFRSSSILWHFSSSPWECAALLVVKWNHWKHGPFRWLYCHKQPLSELEDNQDGVSTLCPPCLGFVLTSEPDSRTGGLDKCLHHWLLRCIEYLCTTLETLLWFPGWKKPEPIRLKKHTHIIKVDGGFVGGGNYLILTLTIFFVQLLLVEFLNHWNAMKSMTETHLSLGDSKGQQ